VEVKHLSALEELLNYELPKHLIAQKLSDPRDACRLLVVHRDTGTFGGQALLSDQGLR